MCWSSIGVKRIAPLLLVVLGIIRQVRSVVSIDESQHTAWFRDASIPIGYNGTVLGGRQWPGNYSIPRRRKLAPSTGNNRVLIVRVSGDNGAETTSSIEDIREAIFLGSPTVASQYEECSNGALTLTDAGDIEIVLTDSIVGRDVGSDDSFLRELDAAVEAQVGEIPGDFDHIIYCLPKGTTIFGDPNWVGFAQNGGALSWYNDEKCLQVLTVMHEIGHNLGLGHSTQIDPSLPLGGEYEDRTCIMGIDDRLTRKCFNPPHSSVLGWYDENYFTTIDAPPMENIIDTCLFGVAEYNTFPPPEEFQLWYDIGDIVIGFNRDTGPNAATQECIDQVVIYNFPIVSPGGVPGSSNLLECLSRGESYVGEGYTVNVIDIDTSQVPGCARVSIVVAPTPAPTPAPGTQLPTTTIQPSSLPTNTDFLIEFFVDNSRNSDNVDLILYGSCGNEIQTYTLFVGQAGNGRLAPSPEDVWILIFRDAGGDGGADYSVSYRGELVAENNNWDSAEACIRVGDSVPICDNSPIECATFAPSSFPTTNLPSEMPSILPSTLPSIAPSPSPTELGSPQPSSSQQTAGPSDTPTEGNSAPESPSPTTQGETDAPTPNALPPTSTPSIVPSQFPSDNPNGECTVQVRIEECGDLVADQLPLPGCDCYNYCDGTFLNCCTSDAACIISCPSGDFVAGCRLTDTTAPTISPVNRPTGFSEDRPTTSFSDDPLAPVPTNRPLPPSRDEGPQQQPVEVVIPAVGAPVFFWSNNGMWAAEARTRSSPRVGYRAGYRALTNQRQKVRLDRTRKGTDYRQ